VKRIGLIGAVMVALAAATAAVAASFEWKVQRSPDPKGAARSELKAVSCTSPRSCTAVGYYEKGSYSLTLAERWSGKRWSIKATPNPGTSLELRAVSCASADSCIAVGDYFNRAFAEVALAERWNARKWSIQHPPNPAGAISSQLQGVSCASPRACTAVGHFQRASGGGTLVERFDGHRWSISIQRPPNPAGASFSDLYAVSCPSRNICRAVGDYNNKAGVTFALAERFNGKKWSFQRPPNPSAATRTFLQGVSCTSGNACTAVGSYYKGPNKSRTLAERWNGSKWSIQHTKNPTGFPNASLNGVSCRSTKACTAVGATSGQIVLDATLVEQWSGRRWAVQRSADPGTDSQLWGVSCGSAGPCTAVGWYLKASGPQKTLVERR
jgi:hypothetical protein